MYSEKERKIPLSRAIGYVCISVLVIWGSLILTWFVHKSIVQSRLNDPRYTIVALVQTCPQKEALENWQLAEILNLNRDKPENLYSFDSQEATKTLLKCPVIKKATCKRLPPGIVHVDYQVRTPCALLADFSNIALDNAQYCFPLRPYFTPKKLPELYLGVTDLSYSEPLDTPEAHLAFKILSHLHTTFPQAIRVLKIDTSKAFIKNAGTQEVVVVLSDMVKTRFLRMSPRNCQKTLDNFLRLQSTFDQINSAVPTQIIDLRSPNIALVK